MMTLVMMESVPMLMIQLKAYPPLMMEKQWPRRSLEKSKYWLIQNLKWTKMKKVEEVYQPQMIEKLGSWWF